MEEERSKLDRTSWITFGVAGLGFVIFAVVFIMLQSGHDEGVEKCVDKCAKTELNAKCRNQASDGGDLCAELCGLAASKAESCMDKASQTCGSFSNCVIGD